ncbi:MFS transporter [Thermotoga sp. KOL6]|uniref:MFS transporter n=1 Tax=Thermotoga sp. KOL6 TaxID=126741 RepID=UPI000C75FE0D|nr:MFS transporter [Thermotoga sp. KOL6]PLV59279.1 MFS transporter [Thermotoga sp. KOL6]
MKKIYLFFTLEGIFSLFYMLLTQGPIFTGLAMSFNLNEFLLSVAAAIPPMMQFFQLFSSFFVRRFKSRRMLVNVFNGLSRYSFSALVIFMLLGKREPRIFLTALTVSQIFAALSGSTWASWMRDLIPPEERGKAFGTRNVFLSIGNAFIIYLYSLIVEKTKNGFELVLLIAAVGTTLSIISMRELPDVPMKSAENGIPLRLALKDTNFMRYVFFTFYWNMAVTFSSAFYHYHLLKNLGISYTYISYILIVNNFIAVLGYMVWSKVSDKIGHKTIAEFGIVLASFVSIMWFFMNRATYTYLMLMDALFSAVAWSAINLSLTVLPMEVASTSDPIFFGVNSSFASLGSLVGSLLGGILAHNLSEIYIKVHNFEIFGLQFLFLGAGFLRFSAIFFLEKVKVKRYIKLREFLFNTVFVILRRPVYRVFDKEYVVYLLRRYGEHVRKIVRRSKGRKSDSGK